MMGRLSTFTLVLSRREMGSEDYSRNLLGKEPNKSQVVIQTIPTQFNLIKTTRLVQRNQLLSQI